jgi:hypothetical protein
MFDHYIPDNGNIAKNYALFCEWYGPIDGLNARKPPPLPLAPPQNSSVIFSAAAELTPHSSDLYAMVEAFLKAWYLDRDYAKLAEFIAKDDAFSFNPIQTETHLQTGRTRTSQQAWREIFKGAFESSGPALHSLNEAIKFVSPTPARPWHAEGHSRVSPEGQTNLYRLYSSQTPPPGTFFPKSNGPGTNLLATKRPSFDARAQYLAHLQQDYPGGQLQVLVYSVIGEGLVREDAILYWICENQKWKLAAFQGTD